MNRKKRFSEVYRKLEQMYGRAVSDLDIERAFARYLKVTGEEAK